jgi:cellulose synthase/poly-beta-1,6-N-acetylglucosamine synthase-like glycosyltransferase
MIIWQFIFWFTLLALFHSYLLFPWLLQLLARKKQQNSTRYTANEMPDVTILISAYNEERVIREKLQSIINTSFPKEKLTVIIGSDSSTDDTNAILKEFAKKYSFIRAVLNDQRQGKPAVINQLMELVTDEFVIMTDANVMFHEHTISGLIQHFKNPEIGLVGGGIINENINRDGVSIQEKAFTSREFKIKMREGLIWGATIGVEGGIFAIRKKLYRPVPKGFSVDDFFISMSVLRLRKKVILDTDVITHEDLPGLISEEYRRKVRIATGNFRNMRYFFKELLTPWKGASFAYISHKVIRWLGPFIMLLFLLSTILLYNRTSYELYNYALYATAIVISLPIIDFFLSKIGIHVVFLRFVRHFVTMNIALFHGFINNIGGITRDVWQPTNR